jgi:cell division septum initiation protein DivIVA
VASTRPEDLNLSMARGPLGHLQAATVETLLQRAAWDLREALAENQRLRRTVEDLTQRVEELTAKAADNEHAVARHQEPDGLTRTLLFSAQRAPLEEEREAARREAELMLKKATRRAKRLDEEIAQCEARHRSNLVRLERQRDAVIGRLRGVLEAIIQQYGEEDNEEAQRFSPREL